MITIGTAKFDFRASNEPFAWSLNGRWDAFFHTAFETVVEEVLAVYDRTDCVITIDSLSLDLGRIDEEQFDKQFALRLRRALETYFREKVGTSPLSGAPQEGITIVSAGKNAFQLLSFFLLHGYFPFTTEERDMDLSRLLKKVIAEEAARFREFLNAYGHYDFLCRRLVFQFTDEELEQIVTVVRPSESNFITLYVRVQIRAYESFKQSELSRRNYRGAVWTLVLAYLFTEGAGYFSRKHIVLYTIRGLAARLNLTMAEMIRVLTESIRELEQRVEQLPELWAILKEIRREVKARILALDGDLPSRRMHEVVSALRSEEGAETEDILSREHLSLLLSEPGMCRRLLQLLRREEIHRIVAVLVPQEKEYVISYASMLDRHKDAGTFSGRAGSEFRLLKWEFIFAVLVAMPVPEFSRKQFVLSVLHKIAAHYNLLVAELIRLLYTDETLLPAALSPALLAVLQELYRAFHPVKKEAVPEMRSREDWLAVLQVPLTVREYIEHHTEAQIIALVGYLFPAQSEFIAGYAALLDKGYERGILEGKAGAEFSALKWEFIFSCLVADGGMVFHRKLFVYAVLQRLAAHYNQEVTRLIGYFLHHLPVVFSGHLFGGLKSILKELYNETTLPMADVKTVRSLPDAEWELWILDLFGYASTLLLREKEEYIEKWLACILTERNHTFRSLWKSGKLNTELLLRVVHRSASLRRLWLQQIGDERLAAISRSWSEVYAALRRRFSHFGYMEQLAEHITAWMVELTASRYAAWSETELIRFLAGRIRQSIPSGYRMLLQDVPWEKNVKEIINYINESNEKGMIMEQITVMNAGMVLLHPFLPQLFRQMGYIDVVGKTFKDEISKIRAIFLLQYLVYGEEKEYPETELFLNKVLVGWENNRPLPRRCALTEEEKKWAGSLMAGVKDRWEKVAHTSDTGIRQSFLQREGIISKSGEMPVRWKVKVMEKPYDVLLDFLPWSLKMFKFSWTNDSIEVNWRN